MCVPMTILELMGASRLAGSCVVREVHRPAEMAAAGSTQVLPASVHSKVQ